METRMFFFRDLREAGIIETKWIKETKNPVDMFTKNLGDLTTTSVLRHLWKRTNTVKQ